MANEPNVISLERLVRVDTRKSDKMLNAREIKLTFESGRIEIMDKDDPKFLNRKFRLVPERK